MPTGRVEHHGVVVVGAGFSGLAIAHALRGAGIDGFVVLERGDDVGGVWRANTYPGCACDVPSSLYSFSFAPNPEWTRGYGTQAEILDYLRGVADRFALRPHVRTGVEVQDARWSEAEGRWNLTTSGGPLSADVLISATGLFGDAAIPRLPGLERFAGTRFHSLHWDHHHDLRGERVAVIGTGASAVQFVPEIQPRVDRLLVFQRTAPWVMPRMDHPTGPVERLVYRRLPAAQRAVRGALYTLIEGLGLPSFVDPRFRHVYEPIGRWHLRRQISDPALRARLTPDYPIGCKRPVLSDAYLPALAQSNVEVLTDAIVEIREHGIVTADGREHPVDTIIFGTGFDTPSRAPERVHGRDGRSVMDVYDERPRSYLGTALAGFPNHFMTLGPFGAASNQSAVFMIERQATYIVQAIAAMRARGARRLEVRPDVQEAFVADVERRSADTVWLTGGCRTYYRRADGRNAGLWPGWSFDYARRVRRFDPESYRFDDHRSAA